MLDLLQTCPGSDSVCNQASLLAKGGPGVSVSVSVRLSCVYLPACVSKIIIA